MDNLSPHKGEPTLSLIVRAGAQVLFLPASSPEFNPIEKMGSKIKASLRSVERAHPTRSDQSDRFCFGKRHTSGCQQLVCPPWL
jgi:transposase